MTGRPDRRRRISAATGSPLSFIDRGMSGAGRKMPHLRPDRGDGRMREKEAGSDRPDGRESRTEALLEPRFSPEEPGVAVLVVKNGQVVFERGYGVAELRTGRPIDARTNFRLASVSKQFTAAAVMLLVRDGTPQL